MSWNWKKKEKKTSNLIEYTYIDLDMKHLYY